ncbi:MAG: hypothetical protein ACRDPT_06325 [Streptomycetales bacterium]
MATEDTEHVVITCLVAAGLTQGKVSIYLSALLIGPGLGGTLLILTVIPMVGLAALLTIRWEPVGKDVETPAGRTALPVAEGT